MKTTEFNTKTSVFEGRQEQKFCEDFCVLKREEKYDQEFECNGLKNTIPKLQTNKISTEVKVEDIKMNWKINAYEGYHEKPVEIGNYKFELKTQHKTIIQYVAVVLGCITGMAILWCVLRKIWKIATIIMCLKCWCCLKRRVYKPKVDSPKIIREDKKSKRPNEEELIPMNLVEETEPKKRTFFLF